MHLSTGQGAADIRQRVRRLCQLDNRGVNLTIADPSVSVLTAPHSPEPHFLQARAPSAEGCRRAWLGDEAHGELVLEHNHSGSEGRLVCQQLEGQRAADLVWDVCHAYIEVWEVHLLDIGFPGLTFVRCTTWILNFGIV